MVNNSCPTGLIELRNSLKRELEDEFDASSRYMEASIKLRHYGKDRVADRLRDISIDEQIHHHILGGVIDLITQECGLGNLP